jgi:hypothetical protein
MRNKADRTRISGFVFFDRILDITRLRASGAIISVIPLTNPSLPGDGRESSRIGSRPEMMDGAGLGFNLNPAGE